MTVFVEALVKLTRKFFGCKTGTQTSIFLAAAPYCYARSLYNAGFLSVYPQ